MKRNKKILFLFADNIYRLAKKLGRRGWKDKQELDTKDIYMKRREFRIYKADFEDTLNSVKSGSKINS